MRGSRQILLAIGESFVPVRRLVLRLNLSITTGETPLTYNVLRETDSGTLKAEILSASLPESAPVRKLEIMTEGTNGPLAPGQKIFFRVSKS